MYIWDTGYELDTQNSLIHSDSSKCKVVFQWQQLELMLINTFENCQKMNEPDINFPP